MSDLHNIVEQVFNLKNGSYCLQIYDDADFNEYIDLEDLQLVKNKRKIKVIDTATNSSISTDTVIEN